MGLLYNMCWAVCLVASAGAAQSRVQVVIDGDPGIDDALAMWSILGDSSVEVLGITCGRGNNSPNNTCLNTLKILEIAGRNYIDVYPGKEFGLVESPSSDAWFGSDGFGNLAYANPPTLDDVENDHASAFLASVVQDSPGKVTIICLGPLTNLALALHLNPQLLRQAKQVIISGGSVRGGGTGAPGAEFNFFMDPHAAAVVLERATLSNVTLTILPLEIPDANPLTWNWRWNVLGKVKNSVVSFMNKLDKRQQLVHNLPLYIPYDVYAAGVLFHPTYVTSYEDRFGYVLYDTKRSGGALMVDYLNFMSMAPNMHVVKRVNVTALKKRIVNNMSNFS